MTIYIVWAESLDWCGVQSNQYKVIAVSEEEAVDKAELGSSLFDEVMEFYDEDESDEDYIEDKSIFTRAEEYNESMHGPLEAYPNL